jgi:hypothetical protein
MWEVLKYLVAWLRRLDVECIFTWPGKRARCSVLVS